MTRTAPIGSAERIGELDVLRGAALLGVFIVHFVDSAFSNLPLDPAVAEHWLSIGVHRGTLFVTEVLFYDKANTLFATLFGMGFWVMMERFRARGAAFDRLYLRRLLVLTAIGFANLALIFPGDVLHTYALLGFALFALRGLNPKAMLTIGVFLAVFGHEIGDRIAAFLIEADNPIVTAFETTFETGRYSDFVRLGFPAYLQNEYLNLSSLGWMLYLFGRFLVGAWIIRVGALAWIGQSASGRWRWALLLLLAGLGIELVSVSIHWEIIAGPFWADALLHAFGVPVLALGYSLCLIADYRSARRNVLEQIFAPAGRMALTVYVAHGAVFTLVFFPFGLGLLGVIGPGHAVVIVTGLYVLLVLASRAWLSVANFGPLEYLWRWATYGARPALLKAAR